MASKFRSSPPGLGFLALPELVAAVSNAGGLGLLGVPPAPAAAMQATIEQTKPLTSRPFGVDLIVDDTAFGPSTTVEHIEVCVAERVQVVVFFWNLPAADWVERLHAAGAKVWMQVGSVEAARKTVDARMDAIIVQGSEAGGHNRSRLPISSLVPAVVDAVAPVPVVAAGGIADGRGVAAALALGADAVCVGTRLVASREAFAHDEHKRRVLAATAEDIARTSTPRPPEPPQTIGRGRRYPKSRVAGGRRIGAGQVRSDRAGRLSPTHVPDNGRGDRPHPDARALRSGAFRGRQPLHARVRSAARSVAVGIGPGHADRPGAGTTGGLTPRCTSGGRLASR